MFSSQWLKNSTWGCIIFASASLLVLLLLRKCLGLRMRNKVVFFRDRFWIWRHIFWGKVAPGWISTEGKEFSLRIFKWKYIWIRSKTCFAIFLSSFKKHKLIFEKKSPKGHGGFCMTHHTFSWRCLLFQVRSLDQAEDGRKMETWPNEVVWLILCRKPEQLIALFPSGLQIFLSVS